MRRMRGGHSAGGSARPLCARTRASSCGLAADALPHASGDRLSAGAGPRRPPAASGGRGEKRNTASKSAAGGIRMGAWREEGSTQWPAGERGGAGASHAGAMLRLARRASEASVGRVMLIDVQIASDECWARPVDSCVRRTALHRGRGGRARSAGHQVLLRVAVREALSCADQAPVRHCGERR